MGRIGRSMALVGQSYRILMQDKELMILPLISGCFILAVAVTIGLGFGLTGDINDTPMTRVAGFLVYVATYAIGIFFQAAVIAGATERMKGGDPTVGSSLAAAGKRIVPILMWAVFAATVGMLLRVIHNRVGFIGRIIVNLVGAAWSLATFFVVPVLVLEERSVSDSFSQSISTFKKTWGESIVGGMSLGVAAFAAWATLIAIVGLLAWAGAGVLALAVMAVGALFLVVFFSALQGIYVASLYQYATAGQAPKGFDTELLSHAFVPKR